MDILGKIEKLKEQRGWSEYELAKKAGINQSTISSLYRNYHLPTIPTLEAICNAFEITLSQFFADANVPVSLTDEQKKMLEQWNLLEPGQKEALFNLMKNM